MFGVQRRAAVTTTCIILSVTNYIDGAVLMSDINTSLCEYACVLSVDAACVHRPGTIYLCFVIIQ